MSFGIAHQLRGLLAARPSRDAWQTVCRLAEELADAELDTLRPAVRTWPAQSRPMPEEWWRQWRSGQRRRCHDWAGYRYLGDISDVESGTIPSRRADPVEVNAANFYRGTSAIAVGDSLRRLVLADHSNMRHGSQVIGWNTGQSAALTWFVSGHHRSESVTDLRLSPDGAGLVVCCNGQWRMCDAHNGFPVWRRDSDHADTRFAFSRDGRVLVGATMEPGSVEVVSARTGRGIYRSMGQAPATLDGKGRVLVTGTGDDGIRVHRLDTAATTECHDTGLSVTTAMAFAPHDERVAIAGAGDDGRAVIATLDAASATVIARTEVSGFAAGLRADSAPARQGSRLAWSAGAPLLFLPTDTGSALCDADGHTRWADPGRVCGDFSPAGDTLVTVAEDVEAWFLAGL